MAPLFIYDAFGGERKGAASPDRPCYFEGSLRPYACNFWGNKMVEKPNRKNRQSIRIPEYDYSQPGAYFVTLVTHDRQCLFGEIIEGRMELSPLGRIAEEQWLRLQVRFPNWATETFQIMPNHMHGVLNKRGTLAVGAQRSLNNAGSESATLRPASNIKGESLPDSANIDKPGDCDGLAPGAASTDRSCASDGLLRPYRPKYTSNYDRRNVDADSLGAVVRAYKSTVAFRFRQTQTPADQPLWQRNYYEHVVRDEDDLDRIRLYIWENPLRWSEDGENNFP